MPNHENLTVDVPTARGPERRGWHIDKTLSISDLIIMAGMLITGLGAYFALKQDGAVQAAQIQYIQAQRAEDRQSAEKKLEDLQQQIRSMDARVTDRLEKIADKIGVSK